MLCLLAWMATGFSFPVLQLGSGHSFSSLGRFFVIVGLISVAVGMRLGEVFLIVWWKDQVV